MGTVSLGTLENSGQGSNDGQMALKHLAVAALGLDGDDTPGIQVLLNDRIELPREEAVGWSPCQWIGHINNDDIEGIGAPGKFSPRIGVDQLKARIGKGTLVEFGKVITADRDCFRVDV